MSLKSRLMVLVVLAMFAVGTVVSGCSGASSSKTIQIGQLQATTGSFAPGEEYAVNATKLAVEEINAKGGIDGKKIELVYEDTASKAATAISSFQKMMSEHPKIVAVAGSELSSISIPIMPYIGQLKVAYLSGATSAKLNKVPDWNNFYFHTVADDSVNASLTVKYLVEKEHRSKFAIIYDTDDFGQGGMESLKAALATYNLQPLTVQAYTIGDKDFTGQLMAIKKSGADTLLGWSHPTEAGLIVKAIGELGLTSQIKTVMGSYYAHPQVVELAGKYATKIEVLSVTDNSPGNPDQRVQDFAKAYQAKYNKIPDRTAMHNYDRIYMLVDVIKKLDADKKPLTAQNVRDGLAALKNWKGVMTNYSFDDKNLGVWAGVIVKIDPTGVGGLKYIDNIAWK